MSDSAVAAATGSTLFGDLEATVAEIAGHLNVQNCRLVRAMADVIERGDWAGGGIHTTSQWLAWKSGVSPERAGDVVAVAERCADFPVVMQAFERGELTLEQVVVVVKKAPAWADAKIVDFASVATVNQLRRTIEDRFFDDGPSDEPAQQPKPLTNRLSFGSRAADRWRLNGDFDAATGSRIEAALTEAKDALFAVGDTDATWADAMVEVAESSLDAVPSESRRDRYRTWLHLDVTNGSGTTTDGWRIPLAIRDRLLCDGVVQPVWERDGVPFSVGRSQRAVPDRTRRIIEHRDRGCRVPGCTASKFVEIHHIIHWLQGGPTDTWNLICICRRHHKMHHRAELGIAGNADEPGGVTFTDANGRVIAESGTPTVPKQPPSAPTTQYIPPVGGRIDHRWFTGWVSDEELARRRAEARSRPSRST